MSGGDHEISDDVVDLIDQEEADEAYDRACARLLEDPTGQSADVRTPPSSDSEVPEDRKRPRVSAKQPRMTSLPCPENFVWAADDFEEPDLAAYFSDYLLDDTSIIAICRTYASYLAAKRKQRGPAKKV